MKGSKQILPVAAGQVLAALIVLAGAFVPHQLLAAFEEALPPWKKKFLPAGAELLAKRLAVMFRTAPVALLSRMPPPPPMGPPEAEFPVIVTFWSVAVSLIALYQSPPPSPPEVLLLMTGLAEP